MVLKIGHRGASGYEPENTLRSFSKAISLGVDIMEFDVQVCKSGEIVIIHDERVERTTTGVGYVSEISLGELKTFDAGKGEKIPTLKEALELIGGKAQINIELKGEGMAKLIFNIIEECVKEKGGEYNNFLVSSFKWGELEKFSHLTKKIRLGVLVERELQKGIKLGEKIKAYSINLKKDLISKELVEEIHQKGLKVFVWTVNDKKEIEKMKKLKVEGIVSDFPDRI